MTRLLSRSLFAGLLVLVCLAPAQQRVGRIQLLVSPDHADWKYAPGENVTFTIRAVRDGAPASGLKLTYSAGPEMLDPVLTRTVTLGAEGLRVDAGTMKQPGFLRLVATVEENGHTYRGLATAGFAPEKIQPVTEDPEGFDAFWREGKDALAKIPIDAERTLLPEQCTATVNVYQVSIQNVGPGANGTSRIFGILGEPKAPGKYPAVLRVPGAGVHKAGDVTKDTEKGSIWLSIGIHGIPLTLDAKVYDLLGGGALNGYWVYNLDSRDRYYYRRVYLGCVRAIDYLTSLPNWDGKTLAVTGGSQGGALSIVTAGLDPRVKALAAYYPALSDMAGYAHGRAGGWPHMFKDPANRTKEKLETAAYYDVVNFARRVKVPGIYSWGYNDETCPPTSIYAAYNVITAPKSTVFALETGHWTVPEQTERMNAWIEQYLKTR
jgi:cephalosporin-C deacetylase-like acetyl esterase